MSPSASVLFVCWGHTCRSVMADAFAKRRYGEFAQFHSAGLYPLEPELADVTLDTLRFEFGIKVDRHVPHAVKDFDLTEFTYVVAMDKEVGRELRKLTPRDVIVWNIKDPWGSDLAELKRCALKILGRLAEFVAASEIVSASRPSEG